MSNTRIPTEISKFDPCINSTDDYLLTVCNVGPPPEHNWERLGITLQNKDDWHAKRLYWKDNLFPKYFSKLTKTEAVNAEVENFIKSFRTFARPLLNIMAASPNANEDDEVALNFKINRKPPSKKE